MYLISKERNSDNRCEDVRFMTRILSKLISDEASLILTTDFEPETHGYCVHPAS